MLALVNQPPTPAATTPPAATRRADTDPTMNPPSAPEPEKPAGAAVPPSVPLESERPAAKEVTNASASNLQNLKFLNAAAFALTALVVLCMVLGRVREEGVFGNEYLWMKYQVSRGGATASARPSLRQPPTHRELPIDDLPPAAGRPS